MQNKNGANQQDNLPMVVLNNFFFIKWEIGFQVSIRVNFTWDDDVRWVHISLFWEVNFNMPAVVWRNQHDMAL